jgi:hypothetical protein
MRSSKVIIHVESLDQLELGAHTPSIWFCAAVRQVSPLTSRGDEE